ncbi:MAG: peptidase S1, partial [Thalassolituus sp. CG17_big_fil_post_rev_8_21_14_2_50_53_8]
GGPLLNMKGELVGINTAIFSRSGGNVGIGFAVPANMAKNIMEQLQKNGKVVRGWLGVVIQGVDQELARKFNLKRPIGALVGEVVPQSPADKAGIKPGDVIVRFKDKEIVRMSMLPGFVGQTPVGEKAALEIVRNGKPMTMTVTIGKMDEDVEEAKTADGSGKTTGSKSLGITVQEVTKELAASLSLQEGEGLLITEVQRDSPAASVRLKKGHLVLELNRKPVNT